MFHATKALFAAACLLCATEAGAQSITCKFLDHTDTTTLDVTIVGTPRTTDLWIWQATMLLQSDLRLQDGTWAGDARDNADFQVAQLRIDTIEAQGQMAAAVQILTGGLVFEPLPTQDVAALTAQARPVWARLTMPVDARGLFNPFLVDGVLEPTDLGVGTLPMLWQGDLTAPPGSDAFPATEETLLTIENLRNPGMAAKLSIYPIADPDQPKPTQNTIPLAVFTFAEDDLRAAFSWAERALPGYLDSFHQGCPQNRQP